MNDLHFTISTSKFTYSITFNKRRQDDGIVGIQTNTKTNK